MQSISMANVKKDEYLNAKPVTADVWSNME